MCISSDLFTFSYNMLSIILYQGFVVMLNFTGSAVWPGEGVAAWYQSQSAVTKEDSSLYEDEKEVHEDRPHDHSDKDDMTAITLLTNQVLKGDVLLSFFFFFKSTTQY